MKERIKSVVLFVLFVMALVLTYLNTLQPFFVVSQSEDSLPLNEVMASVVKPRAIFYSSGDHDYTRIYDQVLFQRIWDQIMPDIVRTLDGSETLTEITKTAYAEAFERESILLIMTGVDRNLITNGGILGSFYCYEEILICDECLNVKWNGKYYSIDKKKGGSIQSIGERIKKSETSKYRRVADRFSLRDTLGPSEEYMNYYPFPYEYPTKIVRTSTRNEFSLQERSHINEVAKIVIGDRLDFTQIFEDSAKSLVFVYHKGEKSLTFTVDGFLLYKARYTDNSRIVRDDFESALAAAVDMITKSGGVPEGLYLKDCTLTESGKYLFSFSYQLAGQYSVRGNHAGIRVLVDGDMVLEMDRKIVFPELLVATGASNYISVDQCIYKNLDIFSNFDSKEKLYHVCSKIEEVNMVFYYNDSELIPAWEVVIDGKKYLFEANNGVYIEVPK